MKGCAKCDVTYPDSSAFCKKCGGPLGYDTVGQTTTQSSTSLIGGRRIMSPTVTTTARTTTQPPSILSSVNKKHGLKCRKCGALNQSGMSFCKSCRAPIGELAKKVRTRRIVAGTVVALALFAVITSVVGWYLWGVKLTIESNPGTSRVFIDGHEVGVTNASGMITVPHIRAGDHDLVVMHEGFDHSKQSFNVAFTDFRKSLTVQLNPTKYKLTIISMPPASEVLVDNQSMGSTNDSTGNLETSPLGPGDYSVTVRHDGYRDWKQNVTLKGDMKIQVTLTSAPVMDQGAESAEYEIRNALEGWAQSTRNRDVDSHLRYYADTLDYYYSRTSVPSSKVREDRIKAFSKFNWLDVRLSNMNVQLDSTGQRATVVFDKTFDFRGDYGAFYNGSVQDQATLTKLGGAWLITGEKELKVYYVNK